MQVLYAYFKSADPSINKYEKELFHSIEKSYELYHLLIMLVLDVVKYAESRIELAKNKRIPTHEDLNPNDRFIKNRVIAQLNANDDLSSFVGKKGISWVNNPELVKELYLQIIDSDYYKAYMSEEEQSFKKDKKLIIDIFSNQVICFEKL